MAEFNYSSYQIGNTKDRFTGYLFAGLSLYSHMPEAEIDGIWYELQPMGTEGQGTTGRWAKRYATTGFAIPFGFGFKWNLGRFSALNIEWGMRRTWTDHLDDVAGYYASLAVLEEEAGPLSELLSVRPASKARATSRIRWANAGLQWPGRPLRRDECVVHLPHRQVADHLLGPLTVRGG